MKNGRYTKNENADTRKKMKKKNKKEEETGKKKWVRKKVGSRKQV